MSPPDLHSLRLSTAATSNTTTSPPSTTGTQPTTPRQPTRAHTTTSQSQADSGIIPFHRTMSIASQENNSPNFGSGLGSPGSSLRGHSESPRLSITSSLQAAAAVNAGLRSEEDSRRSSVGSITRQRSSRSPHTAARRRSTVLMNLQLNDPALPAPGEMVNEPHPLTSYGSGLGMGYGTGIGIGRASPRSMGSPIIPTRDPGHNRAPSLGEIHQELEQEQEAQVNRLLQMIRIQQAQLQALQASQPVATILSTSAIDDATAASPSTTHLDTIASAPASASISPSASGPSAQPPFTVPSATTPIPIRQAIHPRGSFDLSRSVRGGSRTPSRNASPGLPLANRSPSIGPVLIAGIPQYPVGLPGGLALGRQQSEEWLSGVSTRDEAQFYQAEAQMMTRENQMLRLRIRELEREAREKGEGVGAGAGAGAGVGGVGGSGVRRGSVSYEPSTPSGLVRGVSVGGIGGSGRGDRVSEMGQEGEEEEASPRTTPAPKIVGGSNA